MLKPEKWHAAFDSEGKIFCFQKALKRIVLGVCYIKVQIFLASIMGILSYVSDLPSLCICKHNSA